MERSTLRKTEEKNECLAFVARGEYSICQRYKVERNVRMKILRGEVRYVADMLPRVLRNAQIKFSCVLVYQVRAVFYVSYNYRREQAIDLCPSIQVDILPMYKTLYVSTYTPTRVCRDAYDCALFS